MTEIQLSEDFARDFANLQKRVEKGEGEAEYLLKIIDKGIAKIIEDYTAGQKIPKKLFPVYYKKKYAITNLWRLRLDDYWRMIYTLIGERIRIVAVILEILDHKKYDRRFGYK
ncbi:MAG: hypothetical protein KAU24_00625 [Candidatus Aenigmarchaeota archaeon]|nr:hypothetical protein [Candidatus Aenigmarchaeota archaeon]